MIDFTENGDVFSWGCNGNGELGLNDNEHRNIPTLIPFFKNKKVKSIFSSNSSFHNFSILGEFIEISFFRRWKCLCMGIE